MITMVMMITHVDDNDKYKSRWFGTEIMVWGDNNSTGNEHIQAKNQDDADDDDIRETLMTIVPKKNASGKREKMLTITDKTMMAMM